MRVWMVILHHFTSTLLHDFSVIMFMQSQGRTTEVSEEEMNDTDWRYTNGNNELIMEMTYNDSTCAYILRCKMG